MFLSFEINNFPINSIASEDDEKTGKLAGHMVSLIDSLPALQISLGIIVLFEKIYDGKPPSSQSSQTSGRMYNTSVNDEKSVTQPDTVLLLGNNYLCRMTETAR
jgi:hypothetical protein